MSTFYGKDISSIHLEYCAKILVYTYRDITYFNIFIIYFNTSLSVSMLKWTALIRLQESRATPQFTQSSYRYTGNQILSGHIVNDATRLV